jgi:hypothetical protein
MSHDMALGIKGPKKEKGCLKGVGLDFQSSKLSSVKEELR